MDVFTTLHGLRFVWDSEKQLENEDKHGVSFDAAREVFFDRFMRYVDASAEAEQRMAAIGFDLFRRLLFVVHIEVEVNEIRLISARQATAIERKMYEDEG